MSDRPGVSHRPHVVLLSDDPDLSAFLQEGLVYGGFWISLIASGLQALEVFRLRGFDLALIDWQVGGIGAPETIRRLRRRSDRADQDAVPIDIPIAVITGDADEALAADDAVGAIVDAVIAPPIDLEELVPRLHQIVEAWRRSHPDRPWADQSAQAR